jgi:dTDP-4-dehydrorhamnose reductase
MARRVLVFGAGGVVGQHMILTKPDNVVASFVRRTPHPEYDALDMENTKDLLEHLRLFHPDVVVNLAGENRVDVVEGNPGKYENINVNIPKVIANWCKQNDAHMIQVSSQGVFSGENPPYDALSEPDPITEYGKQKYAAELAVKEILGVRSSIARLTFVLGVRPFQDIGRKNPLEHMIENPKQLQVDDRFFSPVFAKDAAYRLWDEAMNPGSWPIHIGIPITVSRFRVAADLKYHTHGIIEADIQPISHEYFEGIAPRPRDTTWQIGSRYGMEYEDGLISSFIEWSRLQK